MNTIDPSQQDNWENNIYILSTTRILMALGLTFLIKSFCQLFQRMRTSGRSAGASVAGIEEAIGVGLEALALGALGDAASFSLEPVNGINEALQITLPQPTYSPQSTSSQYPVSPDQQLHRPEASTITN